jgi:hypothetical protein
VKQQDTGEPAQIGWRIAGEEFASCNCNWARIVLPDGFEYKEVEMGNTVYCRVGAGEGRLNLRIPVAN